jgi:hypothetical protein
MAVTREEVDQELRRQGIPAMADVFEALGITREGLGKQLKRELRAKETKLLKLKRDGKADAIIAEIVRDMDSVAPGSKKKPEKVKILHQTTEELLVAVDVANWSVRQRAREDAQKLLGLYPAERKEITFPEGLVLGDIPEDRRRMAKKAAEMAAQLKMQEERESNG